jgi:uncharacterized membrane protein YoaK (UPF0700 family)
MSRLSKGKSRAIVIFACAVLIASVAAVRFSPHKILWLAGLIAVIPIFAAIMGAVPENPERNQN